jgi:hypothetical protein
MAIIKGTKKILRSDIPDAPDWFSPIMSILNEFLDTVIGALRGKLTFRDNFYSEVKELEFTHGVEVIISTKMPTYEGVIILKTPNNDLAATIVVGHKVRQIKPNTLGITINFAGAGTTTGKVSFLILG